MSRFLLLALLPALTLCASLYSPVQDASFAKPSPVIDHEKTGRVVLDLFKAYSRQKYSFSQSLDCSLCKYGVNFLQGLIKAGLSPAHISDVAAGACRLGNIEDKEVCDGLSVEYQKEVVTVLVKTRLSSEDVCAVMFGDSCGSPSGHAFNWTVPLSPKPPPKPVVLPKPGQPTLRVLQLSDIHFDPLYAPGAPSDCQEPLCCRNNSTPKNKNGPVAGKWGDYNHCDTPLHTFEHMMQHISTQKFDYVMWTGDLPPHDVWEQTREGQLGHLRRLMTYFRKYLPHTPIFPSLGNHESAPVDSFPPPYVKGNSSIHWLYDELAKEWGTWLPKDTFADLQRGAFYTFVYKTGFRIVSVNMNYCNNLNWWLLLNVTDPAGELTWLVKVLQHAEDQGEKVHLVGHIPPGDTSCLKTWSWNYYNIINRYENTIAAQFYGHTHFDHFEVSYYKNRPTAVMYISPSVTPFSYLNPGFRVYTMDGDRPASSRVVLNHETYIMNLTAANAGAEPKWELEYDAKSAYNMTSLLPAEWDNLVTRIAADPKLFDLFYKHYNKGAPQPTTCDDKCRAHVICALKEARSSDDTFCHDIKLTTKLRKNC